MYRTRSSQCSLAIMRMLGYRSGQVLEQILMPCPHPRAHFRDSLSGIERMPDNLAQRRRYLDQILLPVICVPKQRKEQPPDQDATLPPLTLPKLKGSLPSHDVPLAML